MGNTCSNICDRIGSRQIAATLASSEEQPPKAIDVQYLSNRTLENQSYFKDNTHLPGADKTNTGRENLPKVTFESGVTYTGEWKQQKRDGQGTQTWPDGTVYSGSWMNNVANGSGKFVHSNGDTYEGEWKDGKAHGYGVYTHGNGGRYEGYWVDDMQ